MPWRLCRVESPHALESSSSLRLLPAVIMVVFLVVPVTQAGNLGPPCGQYQQMMHHGADCAKGFVLDNQCMCFWVPVFADFLLPRQAAGARSQRPRAGTGCLVVLQPVTACAYVAVSCFFSSCLTARLVQLCRLCGRVLGLGGKNSFTMIWVGSVPSLSSLG